jgi:hypothetical protein
MQTISIGELQKNVGLLRQLKEVITVVDRRQNKEIAVIYPVEESSITEGLSKKYERRAKERGIVIDDLEQAKEDAMMLAMKEKYGFIN